MPPRESFLSGDLMYKGSDDVWRKVPATLQAVGCDYAEGNDTTNTSAFWIHGDDAVEICGTFEPLHCIRKRLSRKRIRKILMSFGIPRNIAEAISREMAQKHNLAFRKFIILLLAIADLNMEIDKNA